MGNIEDKQALVDTLLHNIERLEQSLRRRGADLEELSKKYNAGELALSGEVDLTLLARDRERFEKNLEDERRYPPYKRN